MHQFGRIVINSRREFSTALEGSVMDQTIQTLKRLRVLMRRAGYIPTAVIAAYMYSPGATQRRVGGGLYADVLTISGTHM